MVPSPSVLIVDPSDESREVLRTVLEQQGLRILEADAGSKGLRLAERHQPDLILLDLEECGEEGDEAAFSSQFAETAAVTRTPMIVLGTARRRARGVPLAEYVAKPYQYGPLIRRIEEMLAATRSVAST